MKSNLLTFAALLLTLAITASARADVKVKARQTMGGTTSENTTYIKGKRQLPSRTSAAWPQSILPNAICGRAFKSCRNHVLVAIAEEK
jgi:hypothetical protein